MLAQNTFSQQELVPVLHTGNMALRQCNFQWGIHKKALLAARAALHFSLGFAFKTITRGLKNSLCSAYRCGYKIYDTKRVLRLCVSPKTVQRESVLCKLGEWGVVHTTHQPKPHDYKFTCNKLRNNITYYCQSLITTRKRFVIYRGRYQSHLMFTEVTHNYQHGPLLLKF